MTTDELGDDQCIMIGCRVSIGRERAKATVKYVGPVAGQQGVWVGVEWDDPTRGKHDGSTGGVKYFNVTGGQTAGSFVRAEKVPRGASLLDALRARYENLRAEGAPLPATPAAAAPAAAGGNPAGGSSSGADNNVGTSTSRSRAARAGRADVVLVGEDEVVARQRRTDLIERARLVDADVARVDAANDLAAALPALRELDLSGNLLWRWDEPAALLAALPGLAALNLSGNRLALPTAAGDAPTAAAVAQLPPPPPLPPSLQRPLAGLRTLVLNGCGVAWADVCALQALALPGLRELHLAGNGIRSLAYMEPSCGSSSSGGNGGDAAAAAAAAAAAPLPPPLAALATVEVLALEDNAISEWTEALRLRALPRLRWLNLSGNPIPKVWYPAAAGGGQQQQQADEQQQQQQQQQQPQQSQQQQQQQQSQQQQQQQLPFAALECLLLGGCQLSSWADADALDSFPSLAEARLSGNPVFDGAQGGGRYEAIARVGGLTMLNGAAVRPRERRDCELRYLHAVAAAEAAAAAAGGAAAAAAVAALHPRLGELRVRYAAANELPPVALGAAAHGGNGAAAAGAAGAAGSAQSAVALAAAAAGGPAPAVVELRLLHAGSGRAVTKRLPAGTTVGALRLLCERLLRIKAGRQALTLQLPPAAVGAAAAAATAAAAGAGTGAAAEEVDLGADDTKTLQHWDVPATGATVRVADASGDGSGSGGGDGGGTSVVAAAVGARAAATGGGGGGGGGATQPSAERCPSLRIAAAAVR